MGGYRSSPRREYAARAPARAAGSALPGAGYVTISSPVPERERRDDPERWRCAWNDHGERCSFPGSFSRGTRGEGPWYCSGHFWGAKDAGQVVLDSRDFVRGEPRGYPPREEPMREPGADEGEE